MAQRCYLTIPLVDTYINIDLWEYRQSDVLMEVESTAK